jgi:hypothetical protein
MTIDVHFNNASVAELHLEMHALLIGHAHRPGPVTNAEIVARAEPIDAPKAVTAAQKKAAEKAAKEAAAAAQQAISTGEERTDPAADKQDAADETAETAATKTVDLTHDDVKKLLGGYVMAYGMEAAQADGTGFIGAPKISEIPNTQAALAAAIIGIAKGINNNPNKREINGDGLSPEKTAELKTIVAAAMAVK